jgi:hypothetical protein
MVRINTDKAYILGLIVGGGRIDGKTLQISLPYKKWGDLAIEPSRAGGIAKDILLRLNPILSATYNINVSYTISTDWKIRCTEITESLLYDLQQLGLPLAGEMRLEANLKQLTKFLVTDEHKKRFMAGLVDTVGSLAETHRRFTNEFQIISFEFKGQNFELVADVAEILFSIDCPPDQILWNHPNQHSGNCRYYKSWNKGFKIRVALNDYIFRGTFVFESKKDSAVQNQKMHKADINIKKTQTIREPNRTTLHIDQDARRLPLNIQGGLFIHNSHFNCVLGMVSGIENGIKDLIKKPELYFCPFTCLTKGTTQDITKIIQSEDYLSKTKYTNKKHIISTIFDLEKQGLRLLFGKSKQDGFPINLILQALAYVIAASKGHVIGKRVKGEYRDLLLQNINTVVDIYIPDKGTCIKIIHGEYASLVGYINNDFNKQLIKKVEGYKIYIREPNFEECVVL